MPRSVRIAVRDACCHALARAFRDRHPDIPLDANGYVANASENLLPGVLQKYFEADLRQGAGKELEGKFRAVHSSSALAVNTFARFNECPDTLSLPVGSGFACPRFEQKCPHGVRRDFQPPNLDMIVENPSQIVAVESKCLEYLSSKNAEFSSAYNSDIQDQRRDSGWFREMSRLMREPKAYSCLDAAQLVKHAFGVANTFQNRSATLLYLYWEPANADEHDIFAQHRDEVSQFANAVEGGAPDFRAVSYNDLWKTWEQRDQPAWLKGHVANLRARYSVTI